MQGVRSGTIENAAAGAHDAPLIDVQRPGDSLRIFVFSLLAGAAALLAAVFAFNVIVDPYGTVGTGLLPVGVPEDPIIKVGLMNHLTTPPQVIVLGSSRSMKIQPAYIQQKTGLPGFNAGVRSGTPIDAWAMVNYAHDRFPTVRKHYLWMLDVEAFADGTVKSNLFQSDALSRYFPSSLRNSSRLDDLTNLLSWQATKDSVKVVRAWVEHGTALTRKQLKKQRKTGEFAPDGYRRYDFNDAALAKGRKLSDRLRGTTQEYRTIFSRYHKLAPLQKQYFEKTLAAMNSWGEQPTIVIPPEQPQMLAVLEPLGWSARHRDLLNYLGSLHDRYRFRVVDMSQVSSFGGSPAGFFDGVHMELPNYHRLIDTVLARGGGQL